ncbi:hypothetical protein DSO57_1008566 [Entomophthora muscae]|uniref:Uncharacterized protein n=1 Tax=Entomophthora muscae TaxID=34485 RepID=A0ACC2RLV4_9FUNG|nr:hypothetical protein DSO57_1008566 [Entomophthora muscae]
MDHLVCYLAGNLALGATEGLPISSVTLNDRAKEDLDLAERLAETCWYTYTMNPTGLSAEITFFQTQGDKDAYVKRTDSHSLLRPETIESLFILYRITRNEKYRAWGWEMFRAFEKYAKVETGFTNLAKVTQSDPEHQDKVETFFLVSRHFLFAYPSKGRDSQVLLPPVLASRLYPTRHLRIQHRSASPPQIPSRP